MKFLPRLPVVCVLAWGLWLPISEAADKDASKAEDSFSKDLRPIFAKYCVTCHGGSKPKGHLSLEAFKDEEAILKNPEVLDKIQEKIRAREMPPMNKPQPNEAERKLVTGWIDAKLTKLSQSGGTRDPGR